MVANTNGFDEVLVLSGALLEDSSKYLTNLRQKLQDDISVDLVDVEELLRSGRQNIVREVRISGIRAKAYVKTVKGVRYVILKGYAGSALREGLRGTRYLTSNPKVAQFIKTSEQLIKEGMEGFKLNIILYTAMDILGEILSDDMSLVRLGVMIFSDVVKGAVATAVATYVAGAFLAPVAVAGITTIAVVAIAFAVGISLNYLDNQVGFTKKLRCLAEKIDSEYSVTKNAKVYFSRSLDALDDAARGLKDEIQNIPNDLQADQVYLRGIYWRSIEDLSAYIVR
jgi:hypothetical protein